MKLRIFILACAWTCCVCGQTKYGQKKGFDFQEACFKNPALPYCSTRDFVAKPDPKGGTTPGVAAQSAGVSTVDAAGIDWRFADPLAEAVAVLRGAGLAASPDAHTLFDQLGSQQGLTPEQAKSAFSALAGVDRIALSIRDGKVLLLVRGRPADSILPAPPAGWKSLALLDNTLLIGPAEAVDQSAQRLSPAGGSLGQLPQRALQRSADDELWIAGSAQLAGSDAANAGVKRFQATVSLRNNLEAETVFEFDAAPEAGASHAWLNNLTDAKVEGTAVRVKRSKESETAARSLLGDMLSSSRCLPVPETETTVHTHPVIYGLDGGPREVK